MTLGLFVRNCWLDRMRAATRLGIALMVALFAFIVQPKDFDLLTRLLVSWDLAAAVYLVFAWAIIGRADAQMTHAHVNNQDQSRYVILFFILIAACIGLVAIGFMVHNLKNLAFWPRAAYLTLAVFALTSAWLMIQTVFTFHYAGVFYNQAKPLPRQRTNKAGKEITLPEVLPDLLFPGGGDPDYLDFAYYAFVVGMTSQVSDVNITTRRMRRLTLIHGTLSFIFNIVIVALSINILASVI